LPGGWRVAVKKEKSTGPKRRTAALANRAEGKA